MHAIAISAPFSSYANSDTAFAKARFRKQFQRSLVSCLSRGFSIEESFGLIWLETFEDVPLSEDEQNELYGELIHWAKKARF